MRAILRRAGTCNPRSNCCNLRLISRPCARRCRACWRRWRKRRSNGLFLQTAQGPEEDGGGGAVERGFVGDEITGLVVINRAVVLEHLERIGCWHRDALDGPEGAIIHRAADEPAADGAFGQLRHREKNVMRINAAGRKAAEHRGAPRIAAEEPIALIRKKRVVTEIARHSLVKNDLRGEGYRKGIGGANERHADAI